MLETKFKVAFLLVVLAVALGEDAIEERRLPRAEEAGEDGDGDQVLVGLCCGHAALPRWDG